MTKLVWDHQPQKYESGLDRGVFYPQNDAAEAWNGLLSIQEAPSDTDEDVRYLDGLKTRRRRQLGSFAGAIEALTYPDSFYADSWAQSRPPSFGLSYRVKVPGGHKIHLVYNATVVPSKYLRRQSGTESFSWDFTTLAIPVPDAKMSAHLVIDTSIAYESTVAELEYILYGSDDAEGRLPLPAEVLGIFEENSILRVVDNGDGSFSVTGPDSAITMLDATTFQIDWPSVVYVDADTYQISSL